MNIYSALETQNLIPSANTSNGGQTAEEVARANAEKEKVDFLNLLLTQLSNQNPLDPMDTKDFTAQLTRYSILEQGIETNEKLARTNDLLQTNATTSSFSYIGKEVEVETNINVVQDGTATWTYNVEGNASDVKLTVTDSLGSRITEVDGNIAPGVQKFEFDASAFDLEDGAQLFLSVNANKGRDNQLNSVTASQIMVDGVWTDGGNTYLTAGQISFRPSDVLKLVDGQPQTTTTQTANAAP